MATATSSSSLSVVFQSVASTPAVIDPTGGILEPALIPINYTISRAEYLILTALGDIVTAMESSLTTAEGAIYLEFRKQANALRSFNPSFDQVGQLLSSGVSTIDNWTSAGGGGDLINQVTVQLANLLRDISSSFNKLVGDIESTMQTVWSDVKSAISKIENAIESIVRDSMAFLTRSAGYVVNDVNGYCDNAKKSIRSIMSNIVRDVENGADSITADAKKSIHAATAPIKTAITGVATLSSELNGEIVAIKSTVSSGSAAVTRGIKTITSDSAKILNSATNEVDNAIKSLEQTKIIVVIALIVLSVGTIYGCIIFYRKLVRPALPKMQIQ